MNYIYKTKRTVKLNDDKTCIESIQEFTLLGFFSIQKKNLNFLPCDVKAVLDTKDSHEKVGFITPK